MAFHGCVRRRHSLTLRSAHTPRHRDRITIVTPARGGMPQPRGPLSAIKVKRERKITGASYWYAPSSIFNLQSASCKLQLH
jgi:hypothetical protein